MRLIDADAFIEANKDIIDCSIDHSKYEDTLRELINEAPTVFNCNACKHMGNEQECVNCHDYSNYVHYEERPQGEWSDESKDSLLCSVCGKRVYKPFIGGFPTERTQHYYPNFCAFCGADMRGG